MRALSQDPPFIAATVSTRQATPTQQFEDAGVPYGPTDIVYITNYIWLDELTHFMANGDMSPGGASATDALAGVQTVSTYTIGFAGGNSPVLISAAARGKGANYLAKRADSGLAKALKDAIIAIRDWNPTVAVPLVPVSPIDPSVSSDDIYLAFFGPVLQKCWDGPSKSSNSAAMRRNVEPISTARPSRCV